MITVVTDNLDEHTIFVSYSFYVGEGLLKDPLRWRKIYERMYVVSVLRGKPLVPFQFDLNLCFGFLSSSCIYIPPFTGRTPELPPRAPRCLNTVNHLS